jgi:ssDNA-binding Zn-finger/Zn-ribbon topoisomerase 1
MLVRRESGPTACVTLNQYPHQFILCGQQLLDGHRRRRWWWGRSAAPCCAGRGAPPRWSEDSGTSKTSRTNSSLEWVRTICQQRKQENVNYPVATNLERKNCNSELKINSRAKSTFWDCSGQNLSIS